MGNSIATATASDLGKVTIAHVSDPGTSIEAALTNQTLWTFSLASADQALTVNKIKVDVIGTINTNDLGNLYLYDGVNQIGIAVASLDSDKTLTKLQLDKPRTFLFVAMFCLEQEEHSKWEYLKLGILKQQITIIMLI